MIEYKIIENSSNLTNEDKFRLLDFARELLLIKHDQYLDKLRLFIDSKYDDQIDDIFSIVPAPSEEVSLENIKRNFEQLVTIFKSN